MPSLKTVIKAAQLLIAAVPVVFSVVFLASHSWIYLLLCVISMFAVVAVLPLCRRRESLYMFSLVGFAGFPVNLRLALWLVIDGFFGENLFTKGLWCFFLCCVFFSVEEIVFGIITRMIWKRQYVIKV